MPPTGPASASAAACEPPETDHAGFESAVLACGRGWRPQQDLRPMQQAPVVAGPRRTRPPLPGRASRLRRRTIGGVSAE